MQYFSVNTSIYSFYNRSFLNANYISYIFKVVRTGTPLKTEIIINTKKSIDWESAQGLILEY